MQKEKATFLEKKAALEAIRDESKGTESKAQADRLLNALGRYAVTTFEAMRYLDVYYGPTRVLQLCTRGYQITMHWQTLVTEVGEKNRVGFYVLESGVQHETA